MTPKLLCVYGTLKTNQSNHHYLKHSKLLGDHKTSPEFTMYSMGGFPAVCKEGDTSIHCEVYEVNEKDLPGIYRLEGYTGTKDHPNNWYDCVDVETDYGRAEMFVFKTKPNKSIIKSGVWTRKSNH